MEKNAPPNAIVHHIKANKTNIPFSKKSTDTCTMNFQNHDGKYKIGDEPWVFELEWQNLSQNQMRLYNDPEGITRIALAENISEFWQIKNENSLNFTSRTIEPKENEICIIQNNKGYFAAIKVIKIDITKKLLVFNYQILDDRSCNFSKIHLSRT